MKKIILPLCIIVSFVLVYIFLLVFNTNETEPVETQSVYKIVEQSDLKLQGKVFSESSQNVFIDSSLGELDTIYVSNGQTISIGEPLISYKNLNNKEMGNTILYSIKRLNMNIENIQNSIEQYNVELFKLISNSSNSADEKYEIDAKEKEISKLYEQLNLEKINLEEENLKLENVQKKGSITIFSNIDGTVRKFESSNVSTPIITVLSAETIVVSQISDLDYEKINIRDKVNIKASSDDSVYEGEIIFISEIPNDFSELDISKTSYYEFKIKLSDSNLKIGERVYISIKDNTIKIPKSSVKDGNVYKKNADGNFIKTEIGYMEKNNYYIVISGLNVGDEIKEEYSDD